MYICWMELLFENKWNKEINNITLITSKTECCLVQAAAQSGLSRSEVFPSVSYCEG